MLSGFLFLCLCTAVGFVFLREMLPSLWDDGLNVHRLLRRRRCRESETGMEDRGAESGLSKYEGETVRRWMVLLPASWISGTLCVTWFVYLAAYALRRTTAPLLWANVLAFLFFGTFLSVWLLRRRRLFSGAHGWSVGDILGELTASKLEMGVLLVAALGMGYLDFRTCFESRGDLALGVSAFSDLVTHVSMIRSFSLGANFPTEYVYFADGTVRYHFLFQFLTGNLEYLGMPLALALNLTSILAFVAMIALLFSLTVALCGDRIAALLACVLAFFRSSWAFFSFAGEATSFSDLWHRILRVSEHIGKTPYEHWGLWNQNVFVNQRHFPFAVALLLFVLLCMLPPFAAMMDRLRRGRFSERVGELLLARDAWIPGDLRRGCALGVLLGVSAFWNGAVFIAALLVLFVFALFSKHRLEYLLLAALALTLAKLQGAFFLGDVPAVAPKFFLGFVAPVKTNYGVFRYYLELFGVLPFAVLASLSLPLSGVAVFLAAAGAPFLFANFVQLTPDIVVNHKYIQIAVFLANIPVAFLLATLFRERATRLLGVLLLAVLTVTGVVDLRAVHNINDPARAVRIREQDPVKLWALEHIGPNELVLTKNYYMHPLLAAGRKLYNGWQYYAWSAGYPTASRDRIVRKIFEGTDPEAVKRLLAENRIGYVLVDGETRREFKVNEVLLNRVLERVFSHPPSGTAIYRVPKNEDCDVLQEKESAE